MGLPSLPKIMRTSKHHSIACLLEVEPMLDIVRADIDLHIWEVLVQRPHAAVIGSCNIQPHASIETSSYVLCINSC